MKKFLVWLLGGMTIAAVIAMGTVYVMFDDLIRNQVESGLTPMIEGGVRLGELEFDSATGWLRLEEIGAGSPEAGFSAGPIVLTLDLEQMTRHNRLVIKEMTIEQVRLRGGDTPIKAAPVALGGLPRPSAPGETGAVPVGLADIRVEKLIVEQVIAAENPGGDLVRIETGPIALEQADFTPENFLIRFLGDLQQHIMDAGGTSRAE